MRREHSFKQGNTRPLRVQLTDGGKPLTNLADALNVTFTMASRTGVRITGPATIIDATKAIVEYRWGTTDLDVPDIYKGEFTVTYSSGPTTFPDDGWLKVTILGAV